MKNYDLCIVWNWEYDLDFVTLLENLCAAQNLTTLQVTPKNVEDVLASLRNQELGFKVFLDRASEDDPRFMPLVRWACHHCLYYINHHDKAIRSWDKAAMHYALIKSGVHTPFSFILPSYEDQPEISGIDLSKLGEPFVVKPAHGSGGVGVTMDVRTLEEVHALRQQQDAWRYLLQAHIEPRKLDGKTSWFRVIYCRGRIYPCWWPTETHIYELVTPAELNHYNLDGLYATTKTIAKACELDIFSTEIAFMDDYLFVVVDYVNDQPDLRFKSKAADGVPDEVVKNVARSLCDVVSENATSVLNGRRLSST